MKWRLLLTCVLVVAAFFLRKPGMFARAPFDWDQNRDYSEVVKIAEGKYVPLGPVAKGSGGFYLGSFYYYLLFPVFLILDGDLKSLPLTSTIIDCLTAGLIFFLLAKYLGNLKALIASSIWIFSWFFIEASHVSWNVSLVPIWSLLTLFSFTKLISEKKASYLYLLAFLFGMSFHIHVSAILVIPILFLISIKKLKISLKNWIYSAAIALIPLLPLIGYDLTHSFENLKLVKNLASYQSVVDFQIKAMVMMAFTKFGKVVSGIMLGKFADNLLLGIFIFALSIRSIIKDNIVIKYCGYITTIVVAQVVLLHDIGFPEYYFSVAYIGVVVLFVDFIFGFASRYKWGIVLPIILIIYIGKSNFSQYNFTESAYSLQAKEALVDSLVSYNVPLDVRLDFRPGRDGGFSYLLSRSELDIQPGAITRILITDKVDGPLYVDGELAQEQLLRGNMKTALDIVQ